MKRQVPWDPGGLTRYRLEDKLEFKKGEMLAIILSSPWAGRWAAPIGPELVRSHRTQRIQIHDKGDTNNLAWIRMASASSLMSPFFSLPCSSSFIFL
jgi:hypothetical protein